MKTCTNCKESKSIEDFYINSMHKSGYNHQCKECHKAWMKDYYARRKTEGVKVKRDYKRCAKCKEIKQIDEYGKKTQSVDGKNQYCKICWRAYVYARL